MWFRGNPSCQIPFSPALPCSALKMQLFYMTCSYKATFCYFSYRITKTQEIGVGAKPVPRLQFQPELCSWEPPSAWNPSQAA